LRTLGSLSLALLLQAEGTAAPPLRSTTSTLTSIVSGLSPVSYFVLSVLILFSIVSWSVFLFKLWTFRRGARQSAQFLDVFRRSSKFSEVQAVCRSLGESPLVGLFQSGYAELTAQLRQHPPDAPAPSHPGSASPRPTLKSLPAVDRALLRASAVELGKLERLVPVLATTASVCPFIGLFGTVWGIMMAFQSIGETGSTNFGIVGPSIAEALIATAAGLVAAIPAVMFYNYLSSQVKTFATDMDDFSMEFLNIAERNFT
jgi:biopolymer transport protein TolQ